MTQTIQPSKVDAKRTVEMHAEATQLAPHYSNVAFIAFTRRDFTLDFGYQQRDMEAFLVARIATTPGHVKALHTTLGRMLTRYEEKHGPIEPEDNAALPKPSENKKKRATSNRKSQGPVKVKRKKSAR